MQGYLIPACLLVAAMLSAATTDPVQTIIDDMTLPPDAALHGTEGLDWGDGRAGTPTPVPTKNWKGEWFRAMTNWGQVYIPREGSTATNSRCQIRNLVTKLLRKDGSWQVVQSGGLQGAAFRENFANNEARDAGVRDESANGGGVSMKVGVGDWAGFNYHFWSTGSRAAVDVDNTVAVYTACEARLIVDDPGRPDDLADCRNLLQMGGDWWLGLNGGWLPDWSANSGICGGRARWVTSSWQTFSMCTPAPNAIRANPPIEVTFLPGDANRDGVVDATDLGIVTDQFGRNAGSAGYDSRGDLDGSDRVDAIDLGIVTRNLGR